ncbi:MAG: hypothetical protein BroJett040_00590 [Oligoflexia bacterium]|nr:MAG: hypothetical protein BroJett040_00590 [Oligoflexia bacterium]
MGRRFDNDECSFSAGSISLIHKPVVESEDLFRKRRVDVQSLIVRMVLIGRKKSRTFESEERYEEAA